MTKLRLGPVEEDKPSKVTIELSGTLMRDLSDYSEVHAKATGLSSALPIERLIPPMIARFIGGDREFSKMRRRS